MTSVSASNKSLTFSIIVSSEKSFVSGFFFLISNLRNFNEALSLRYKTINFGSSKVRLVIERIKRDHGSIYCINTRAAITSKHHVWTHRMEKKKSKLFNVNDPLASDAHDENSAAVKWLWWSYVCVCVCVCVVA